MNAYQKAKERARGKAMEWQTTFNEHNYSYEELVEWQEHFEKLGRRCGLLAEFRENGII